MTSSSSASPRSTKERESLHLDPESLRLVEVYHQKFVHAGANLSDADKAKLKKLNEEESTLSNAFSSKLLAATKDAAYFTTDKASLAGLSDAQIAAAAQAAKGRRQRRLRSAAAEHHATARSRDVERPRHAAGAL